MKPEVEVALSVAAYSACSGTLVLLNKLILYNLPYPSLVVVLQLVATLMFIRKSLQSVFSTEIQLKMR